jgi:hypothetical protein
MEKNLFDYDLESYLNLKNPQLKVSPPPIVEKKLSEQERLERVLEMAKKTLDVQTEKEVMNHLSVNGKFRLTGQNRVRIKNNPELYIQMIKKQIFEQKPIKYLAPNSGSKKLSSSALKNKIFELALAGKVEEIKALTNVDNDLSIVRKKLRFAVLQNNRDQVEFFYKKYMSLTETK